jgi:hypothetical protein
MKNLNGKQIHYKEAEYMEFARFCSLPKNERNTVYGFSGFLEFAHHYGMNENTLTLWRKEPAFWEAVDSNRKSWFKERTPEVLLALYRTILKKGQANEVGLWLKYIEEWAEKSKTEVEGRFETTQKVEATAEVEKAVKEFVEWRKKNEK